MSEIVDKGRVDAILDSGVREWPERITIVGYDFHGADLRWAEIRDVTFLDCSFYGAWLDGAEISRCHFDSCNLQRLRAKGAKFSESTFETCGLHDSCLSEAEAKGCTFIGCVMVGSDWSYSNLHRSRFRSCIMSNTAAQMMADESLLSDAKFTMCEMGGISLEMAAGTNVLFDRCDLPEAVLSRTAFTGLVVRRCSLRSSWWRFARTESSCFEFSELVGADFSDANFQNHDFTENWGMAQANQQGMIWNDPFTEEDMR